MRKMLVGSVCLVALVAAACGDDGTAGAPDAAIVDGPSQPDAPGLPDAAPIDVALPPDAMFMPGACPTTYGPASIVNTFSLSDSAVNAFDLDGDGTGDNALGPTAALINGNIGTSLSDGSFRLMSELRMLDDATLMNDSALLVVPYSAVDTDSPVNAGDDFSHSEPFYFARASVDPTTCDPYGTLHASLTGGAVSSLTDDSLPVNIAGFGAITFGRPRLTGNLTTDTAGFQIMTGRLGGAIPTCALENMMAPLGNNALHALAGFLMIQPDIDLDGDGLEVITADSGGIISCTDGDGTVITGDTCGCDPRIVDGYSALFDFTAVGASIAGPEPGP